MKLTKTIHRVLILACLTPFWACVTDSVKKDLNVVTEREADRGLSGGPDKVRGRQLADALLRHFGRYLYVVPEEDDDPDCRLCVGLVHDEAFVAYLNGIAKRLDPVHSPTVMVMDVEEHLAFGLPGHYLLVSLGALRAAEGPDEVAGILAQEIVHLRAGHYEKKLEKDFAGQRQLKAAIRHRHQARTLLKKANEDEWERTAARESVQLLKQAGFDPGLYYQYMVHLGRIPEPALLEPMKQSHAPRAKRMGWYRDALRKAKIPIPGARRPDNTWLKFWETLRR